MFYKLKHVLYSRFVFDIFIFGKVCALIYQGKYIIKMKELLLLYPDLAASPPPKTKCFHTWHLNVGRGGEIG